MKKSSCSTVILADAPAGLNISATMVKCCVGLSLLIAAAGKHEVCGHNWHQLSDGAERVAECGRSALECLKPTHQVKWLSHGLNTTKERLTFAVMLGQLLGGSLVRSQSNGMAKFSWNAFKRDGVRVRACPDAAPALAQLPNQLFTLFAG